MSGDIVHVGGDFYSVEGTGNQRYYAQFDINTGLPLTSFSVNSTVSDMVSDGENLYLSGSFYELGTYKGYLLSYLGENLFPEQSFPNLNSTAEVIEPDGNGGYYIGGSFSSINGSTVNRLTHILADGTIDPDFSASFNSTVISLFLDGTDLYAGGYFTQVNGTAVGRAVRVNASTGALDETWLPDCNSAVKAIAVTANEVHLGGSFYFVNGTANTQYYAALDKTTAEVIPTETLNSEVNSMVLDGDQLYMAGSFTASGYYQNYMQLFATDNDIPVLDFPTANYYVSDALSDGSGGWYISGGFSQVGGVNAQNIAHILADNSIDPDFVCSTNSTVNALAMDGEDLYLCGGFTTVNGEEAIRVARVNKNTGVRDASWSASPNSTVNSIEITSDKVLIGGSFYAVNSNSRYAYFAALSKTDGSLLLTPTPNSTVNDIEIDGDDIYASGSFSNLGYYVPYFAGFSDGSSIPDLNTSSMNYIVYDKIDDGSGGYYLAGAFSQVNGNAAYSVVHYLSDGSLDPSFQPGTINSTVYT
ncbi:MAG: delta-60 repeat domain-containing protein, partial [Rhodanobacteraceae bacterium]